LNSAWEQNIVFEMNVLPEVSFEFAQAGKERDVLCACP
jgi:hypothetical protein